MHSIHMAEVTKEFAECWRAAVSHIEKRAQGPLKSWIKGAPVPPFLEHMSFRLGNQLFFVRIEDIEGALEVPGSRSSLASIAGGMKGHACILPMRKRLGRWIATEPGWGLLDLYSSSKIDPPSLVTDQRIEITNWELQDFAVQIVLSEIRESGRRLMSWNSNPDVSPSIWFDGSTGPEWVFVRSVRYPEAAPELPESFYKLKERLEYMGHVGYVATVRVAFADDPFDPDAAKNGNYVALSRGEGMLTSYGGIQLC